MATKFDSTFLEKLLAPLPVDVEQVDTKAFHKQIRDDLYRVWHPRWLEMLRAKALRDAAWAAYCIAKNYGPQDDLTQSKEREIAAAQAYWNACDALVLTPAPRLADLRWKEGTRGFGGGRPEWEAQIAADAARLGGKIAGGLI